MPYIFLNLIHIFLVILWSFKDNFFVYLFLINEIFSALLILSTYFLVLRKPRLSEWMARQSVGFGDHYQAVAKITGLHLTNKEILTWGGLLSCLNYYLD